MSVPREYCTLFDRNYLPRAVALYRSLERLQEPFCLRAVCMDEQSHELLAQLSLTRMRALRIAEVEQCDAELRAVKPTRSAVEYCWTATPAVCRHLLDREPELEAITYLDADLCVSSSPAPLLAELGAGSVLLIPHRGTPQGDAAFGVYNVGWITFRNDEAARAALDSWRKSCLEWCYNRVEPGRHGDQKYLDDWPRRFSGVVVSAHPGAGLAPWNHHRHQVTRDGRGRIAVDGRELIFHHHAGVRVHRATRVTRLLARVSRSYRFARGPAPLVWTLVAQPPPVVVDLVCTPYAQRLAEAVGELRTVGADPSIGMSPLAFRLPFARAVRERLPRPIRRAYRRLPADLRHRVDRALAPR